MCGWITQTRATIAYAKEMALGPDAFEWFKVSIDVNKAGRSNPNMIEPISQD